MAAAGARVAIIDLDGSEPVPLATEEWRDRARRRLPPHLDPRRRTWRGIGPATGFGFVRRRALRDAHRRDLAGERRQDLHYEVRRLGPGDAAVLRALPADAWELHPAGRATNDVPLADQEAVRYLRDPSVRHWIAEERVGGQILGHLAAHLHVRPVGPPTVVVVALSIRPEHRDGLVGIRLTAAMSDEAARLGAAEIVALVGGRAAAGCLRRLGFRRRPRRPPLLTLPG